ncbi:MAG: gliding motility-associated protein GldE [Prevotella sp.]
MTETLLNISLEALVDFHPITASVIIAAALAVALLFLSGFASGSEIAFFSLSPDDINELEPEKNEVDAKIQQLREDNERTLATILIANNFVNVMIIMLCNYIFAQLITFKQAWLQFLCITVILTFLLLLFGEIMPKVYSRQNPLNFCRRAVHGVMILRSFFWPLETILMRSGVLAEKAMPKENRQLSVDDLEQALELTDKDEIKDEQSMLKGIIRFGDETAKEIMTSRHDIVDINIKSSYADVLKSIIENNYSRIPVFQDNEDNIRGVLYIKDLLPYLQKPGNFRWQSLIRPPYFVPETKKIDDLLREFQDNKVHIAIVVDEFGGTSGIVTMEDILEEIVGEINDEYDEEERTYTKLNYNTYVFEGKTLLSDFSRILNIDDDEFEDVEGDADTLAGLLLEIKGDFPSIHEKIEYKNYTFEVVKIEERRISRIKVTVHEKPKKDAADKD